MNELKTNKGYLLAGISVSTYKCFNTPGNKTANTGRCDKQSRAEPVWVDVISKEGLNRYGSM